MGEKLGKKAQARLEKMGVEIQLNAMVTDVDRNGITVKDSDGTTRRIECATKVWSAGVSASPLGKQMADQSTAEVDRAGRLKVSPISASPVTQTCSWSATWPPSKACRAWRRAPSKVESTSPPRSSPN